MLLRELLVALGFMFLGSALLYWRESRLLAGQKLHLPWGAKVHLSVLAGLAFLIGAWFFMLQRYNLLYDCSHIPLFFGPGYAQMRVILPLIWLAIVLLLAVVVSLIFFLHTHKGLKVCLIFTALFFLALGALYSPVLPNLVQKYIVAPNQIVRERPFLTHNIKATLAAYDLTGVETRNYPISDLPWDVRSPKLQATLRNIPVWDAEVLEEVFQQLQGIAHVLRFQVRGCRPLHRWRGLSASLSLGPGIGSPQAAHLGPKLGERAPQVHSRQRGGDDPGGPAGRSPHDLVFP